MNALKSRERTGQKVSMIDLMGKEDALKVLDMFLFKQCDLERTSFAYDQSTVWGAVKMATDALAGIGKQAAEPAWIPVTERLPKETGLYLISIKTKGVEVLEEIYPDGLVYVSAYDAVIMHWGYGGENVQAWMQLPEPYKEADHD